MDPRPQAAGGMASWDYVGVEYGRSMLPETPSKDCRRKPGLAINAKHGASQGISHRDKRDKQNAQPEQKQQHHQHQHTHKLTSR